MKKISFIVAVFALTIISCKNEKKPNETVAPKETASEKFVVKPEGTSLKWTAYKTTEKKAVGGEFSVLNFENKTGNSVSEALNNLKFSIPISNLITKDEGRDAKIKAFFFGAMANTELISGELKYINNKYIASITMNGVTKDLPLEATITEERRVSLKGTMQLKDWNALEALASLNKVCFELHKGGDGVSKTWEDVAIELTTYLRKN